MVNTFMAKFYFWNLLSAHVYETSLLRFAVGVFAAYKLAPAAEARLGGLQSVQYLFCVLLATSLATSSLDFFLYVLFRNEARLFGASYGYGGLLGALLMNLVANSPQRKVWPEAPAPVRPYVSALQLRQLPLTLCVTASVLSALGLTAVVGHGVTFLWLGSFGGWAYLRYVAMSRAGVRGDFREEFKLVALFPAVCRRPLETVGAFAFGIMILLGFFKERVAHLRHLASAPDPELMDPSPVLRNPVIGLDLSGAARYALGGSTQDGGANGGGGGMPLAKRRVDPVAERRRELAKKALDERLRELEEESMNDWSDDGEEEEEDPEAGLLGDAGSNKENTAAPVPAPVPRAPTPKAAAADAGEEAA